MDTDQTAKGEPDQLVSIQLELARADLELKRQEQAYRDREFALRERDLKLKEDAAAGSRWTNPLVVAVLAAAAAGLGNAAVAVINGNLTRGLEASKAESDRVLEVIKTGGDTEKAAENLRFLLRAGLVTSNPLARKLSGYLGSRRPGTGVTLPTMADRLDVSRSTDVPDPVRLDMTTRLGAFVAYLSKIGFPPPTTKVQVSFLPTNEINAYYSPSDNKIYIGPRIAADRHAPLATYAEFAMLSSRKRADSADPEYQPLDIGVSDYLAASFLSDPKVGSVVASVMGVRRPSLRDLAEPLSYRSIKDEGVSEPHEVGHIFGSAFWAIRGSIGRDRFDPVLVMAWKQFRNRKGVPLNKSFLDVLVSTSDHMLQPSEATAVRTDLDVRGFPLTWTPPPLYTANF